jgi:hypothetical protein
LSGSGEGDLQLNLDALEISDRSEDEDDIEVYEEPSAKALGKRKVLDSNEIESAFKDL